MPDTDNLPRMEQDIRNQPCFREARQYFGDIHAPNGNAPTDAADVCAEPSGRRIALTGTFFGDLDSAPVTRVCIVDAASGNVRQLPCPANSDRLPRWSPNGEKLAFLSDRAAAGNSQLCLAPSDDLDNAAATPEIGGFVEYLQWSPDGSKILLGVAGFGADLAGYQGGDKVSAEKSDLPDWIPHVDTGDAKNLWRSIYVHDIETGDTRRVSAPGQNYWEACWLGEDSFLCVVTDSHGEGSWYRAKLRRFGLDGSDKGVVFSPQDQIGLPAASPSGAFACITEAVCSDRGIVCGTLRLIDMANGDVSAIDTDGVEVTAAIWRDENTLLYSGHRGFETVVAEYSVADGNVTTHWCGANRTFGAWYPSVWPYPNGGAIAVGEAYDIAPELVSLIDTNYSVITSFASEASRDAGFCLSRVEPVTWSARDGLEIQGWLIRPHGEGPFPLVVDIHGGPVWQCRNRWAGRLRGAKMLADHGIASLYPNPRGSSGRGQDFARLVKGDLGGEDSYDYLTGCDALVERGIADPFRLGVTGISYGGFMSAWLITQDERFAAAVPISSVSNWYSLHRTTQIPYFDECFLGASAYEAGGKFFHRSPAMFAANVKTPTLQLTGARDQNTPPTQALEFHRSLLEQGVRSVLVTYPTAGHGIRSYPEVIDHTARYVGWFLEYLTRRKQES